MMKYWEEKFDPLLVLGPADEAFRAGDQSMQRSPGLHLSTIYQDIVQTIDPPDNTMTEQELQHYRAGGFLWERVMSAALAGSLQTEDIVRPGEFTKDGIIGSPDLLDLPQWVIIDTKCTWRSAAKLDNIEKFFWVWLVQLKGYCSMVDTCRAQLLVMFVNGDYRPPRPCIRRMNFEFTRRELSDNWLMLVNHAANRGWL